MRAYRVIRVYGITYNHHERLLPIEVKGIQTMPLRKLEENLFRALQTPSSDDPIVKLRIITQEV
jgi:hypothetical protein